MVPLFGTIYQKISNLHPQNIVSKLNLKTISYLNISIPLTKMDVIFHLLSYKVFGLFMYVARPVISALAKH